MREIGGEEWADGRTDETSRQRYKFRPAARSSCQILGRGGEVHHHVQGGYGCMWVFGYLDLIKGLLIYGDS